MKRVQEYFIFKKGVNFMLSSMDFKLIYSFKFSKTLNKKINKNMPI